jgi:hypothetical protein
VWGMGGMVTRGDWGRTFAKELSDNWLLNSRAGSRFNVLDDIEKIQSSAVGGDETSGLSFFGGGGDMHC